MYKIDKYQRYKYHYKERIKYRGKVLYFSIDWNVR